MLENGPISQLRLSDVVTIQELDKQVEDEFGLTEKWYAKVALSVEQLKILHDISQEHTFNCKEWIRSTQSMNLSSPPLTRAGDTTKDQQDEENEEGIAFEEAGDWDTKKW